MKKSIPEEHDLWAVLYARVSHGKQRDKHTIASQLYELPLAIDRNGHRLAMPADTYVDEAKTAKSGHLEKRTGLEKLFRDAFRGKFRFVYVVDLDRLCRADDMVERGLIFGTLQRAGVQIYELKSGQIIDPNTQQGDWQISIGAVLAAAENRTRMDRAIRGHAKSRRQGTWAGGTRPYGMKWTAEGGWQIVEKEARWIREAYERVANGEPAALVGKDFDRRQIPPPGTIRNPPIHTSTWAMGLYNILMKPRYRGEWASVKGKPSFQLPFQIVSPELWTLAVNALAARGKKGVTRTKGEYLIQDVGACGHCGAKLGIRTAQARYERKDSKWARNPNPARYICVARRDRWARGTTCEAGYVKCADVDARVWKKVKAVFTNLKILAGVVAELEGHADEGDQWAKDLAGWNARLEKLGQKEEAILAQFQKDRISEAVMDKSLASLAAERKMLLQQIETAGSRTVGLKKARASMEAVRDQILASGKDFDAAPFAERAKLVRAVVSSVKVAGDDVQVAFRFSVGEADESAHTYGSASACRRKAVSNHANGPESFAFTLSA